MIDKRGFGRLFGANLLRKQRVAAAVALLFALALQCFDVHAELLFRSVSQVNGEQHWSDIRKYGNPSDAAYARASAGGAVPADQVQVLVSGPITRADLASAAVMVALIESGKQKIAGNLVWLGSAGGDIDAAMELGRLLRKLGVSTFVGKSDQCYSACVFAFMGGERRSVAGQLGIHRPYFPMTQDFPGRKAKFREMQKILRDYIEELDFPASLYEAMMLVPPETMRILAPAELKTYYLEGISPSSEDLADAAAARRLDLSMFEYLQRKAKTTACASLPGDQSRCEGNAREAANDPGSAQKGEAAPAGGAVARGAPGP